jgi:hypothetical protein
MNSVKVSAKHGGKPRASRTSETKSAKNKNAASPKGSGVFV